MIPALAVVLTAGLAGCNKPEEEVTPGKTVFELTQDTVRVAAEGGQASIGYRLEEPQEGASVQPDYDADWLGDFDASVEGTITFTVAANEETEPREAEVTVAYAGLTDSFIVSQAAAGSEEPEPDPDVDFIIEIASCDQSSVTVNVAPKDKEIAYDLGAITPESLNMFPDNAAFVEEYLIPYYEQAAQQYNMTLDAFLTEWLLTGDQSEIKITGLSAEREYFVYCVGLSLEGEMTTELVTEAFTTPAMEAFEAEVSAAVDGPDVTVTVNPADPEEGYVLVIFEGHGHDDAVLVASGQQYIESLVMAYTVWGMSRDAVVAMITRRGEYSESSALSAVSDYTAAAFAVTADGYVCSNPAVNEFTTGEVPQSENEITVTYDNITGRKVEFTVNTTNEDPYVFMVYQYADSFKDMTDDEITAWIVENNDLSMLTRYGSVTSYETHLRELTEYVIYAFGYSGGEVNTKLFKSTFTTVEAELNDCSFSYDYGPYYNGDEAAEKYPEQMSGAVGRIVFPATYVVEGDWFGIWHDLYQGDITDETQYPDEDVYQVVVTNGNTWLSANMIYYLNPGEVYTLCGFVETEDGNFSELYRQVVGPYTLEGCSPIEDFNPQFAPAMAPFNADVFRPVSPLRPMTGEVFESASQTQNQPSQEQMDKKTSVSRIDVSAIEDNDVRVFTRTK